MKPTLALRGFRFPFDGHACYVCRTTTPSARADGVVTLHPITPDGKPYGYVGAVNWYSLSWEHKHAARSPGHAPPSTYKFIAAFCVHCATEIMAVAMNNNGDERAALLAVVRLLEVERRKEYAATNPKKGNAP